MTGASSTDAGPGTPAGERGERVEAPIARGLAWTAVAGQAVFITSWVVAGALEPGYSHVDRYVSELAGRSAEVPWVVRLGFVVWGLSLVALAPGLWRALRRSSASIAAIGLFTAAGVALALIGLFPLDCPPSVDAACAQAATEGATTGTHVAHTWLGLAARLLVLSTPFALAAAVVSRPLSLAALWAGVFGVAAGIGGFLLGAPDVIQAVGLLERAQHLLLQAWVAIVATGILAATRSAVAPTEATPMSPRAFFGSSWVGDGEVIPFPAAVWRRFPLRLRCSRDIAWLSDDVGYIDDRVVFENGWTQARRRFCHLVSPQRIHVTADDLPGGADLLLEEGGYRIAPYTLLVPLGPAFLPVRCREQHRLSDDGLLEDRLEMRLLGMPAGRIQFRVRRVDA